MTDTIPQCKLQPTLFRANTILTRLNTFSEKRNGVIKRQKDIEIYDKVATVNGYGYVPIKNQYQDVTVCKITYLSTKKKF